MAKRRRGRKKTIETRIEVHRVVIQKRHGASESLACEECLRGQMLAPEEASVLLGVPNRTIYRCVEDGLVHYLETIDRLLLVCTASLMDVIKSERCD